MQDSLEPSGMDGGNRQPGTEQPSADRQRRSSLSLGEKRLLMGAGWMVALLFAFLPLSKLPPTPPDLAQFYFAGQLVAAGQAADIYNKDVYVPLAEALAETGTPISRFHFYNRPAFGALPWAIIAQLPYSVVEKLSIISNLLGILLLTWKLPIWFPTLKNFRPWLLCYPPFIWCVQFGQDTIFITWAVAYSIVLMRRGSDRPAGLLLALCVVKPHLVWLMPVALFFCKKRTAAYWFVGAGLFWAVVSFLMVGPSGVAEWRQLLSAPTTDHAPETMATLRAVGLQTHSFVAIAIGTAVALCLFFACRSGELFRALPIALVAGVLLSPHAYVQDASAFVLATSFSGSALLISAVTLPWPELMVLIHPFVAFPFSYVALGLVVIAYFTLARRRESDSDDSRGKSSGAN